MSLNVQLALFTPFAIQGIAMMVDEFYFHHRRRLGRWERIGHPADTLSVVTAYTFLCFKDYSEQNAIVYSLIAVASCILITKDEWVHSKECQPAEQWLHSVLFILHPVTLFLAGYFWANQSLDILYGQLTIVSIFLIYQIIYWNFYDTRIESKRN